MADGAIKFFSDKRVPENAVLVGHSQFILPVSVGLPVFALNVSSAGPGFLYYLKGSLFSTLGLIG